MLEIIGKVDNISAITDDRNQVIKLTEVAKMVGDFGHEGEIRILSVMTIAEHTELLKALAFIKHIESHPEILEMAEEEVTKDSETIAVVSNQPSYKCIDCGESINSIWVIDRREAIDRGFMLSDLERRKLGRCDDCHNARNIAKFPPPRLTDLGMSTEIGFKEYRSWPWFYIPACCQYCFGEIESTVCAVDTERDHVMSVHYCKACKVFYGTTD